MPSTSPDPEGRPRPRLPYLPGLDGLRALAVMAVLLYHAPMTWMQGGFLGVEVFFVISGYLITSLLLAEWQLAGQINLGQFWLRRARRLLPALYVLILAVLAYSVVFLPGEVATQRGDAAAAMVYAGNWFQILSHKSYFIAIGRPSLLQHLWSLAVEEQFYLIWPPLLALALGRWRKGRVLAAVLLVAAASAALRAVLFQPEVDPSRVYYGTDTRASGLLLGSALAFVWAPGQRIAARFKPELWIDLVGVAGLAGLGWFFSQVNEFEPFLYQVGFVLLGLATVAIIASVVHPGNRLVARVLGCPPLRWIGLRSYGIYLWHWPVFMLTRPQLDLPLTGLPLLGLRLGLTAILVELSYRFIETPIRSGALERAWRAWRSQTGRPRRWTGVRWGAGVAAFSIACVLLGESVVTAQEPAPPPYLAVQSINTLAQAATPQPVSAAGRYILPPIPTVPMSLPSQGWSLPVGGDRHTAFDIQPVLVITATATPTAAVSLQEPDIYLSRADHAPRSRPAPEPTIAPTAEPLAPPTPEPTSVPATDSGSMVSASMPLTPGAGPQPSAVPEAAATPAPAAAPASEPSVTPEPAPEPAATPAPADGSAPDHVSLMGDSVMLGAVPQLQAALPSVDIDAAVGRQVSAGIALLQNRLAANQLGPVVVIHLGSNGTFTARQFDAIMQLLAGEKRVVFVTDKVPRTWEAPNNQVLSDGVTRYPNAVLVDWRSASADHPEYFWGDGIHLRPEGAQAYASLIAAAAQGK